MKLKRFIQKAIRFLTKPRYITLGFGSEDEEIAQDFKQAKENFQIINFQKIMLNLVKFERDLELSESGLLLTDNVAIERALAKFQQAKRDGKIDELNNIIRNSEEIKK